VDGYPAYGAWERGRQTQSHIHTDTYKKTEGRRDRETKRQRDMDRNMDHDKEDDENTDRYTDRYSDRYSDTTMPTVPKSLLVPYASSLSHMQVLLLNDVDDDYDDDNASIKQHKPEVRRCVPRNDRQAALMPQTTIDFDTLPRAQIIKL
jgi:hypothetical protein